jgi:hypothetical protein
MIQVRSVAISTLYGKKLVICDTTEPEPTAWLQPKQDHPCLRFPIKVSATPYGLRDWLCPVACITKSSAVLVYDIEASEYITFEAHGDELISMLRSASTDAIVILRDCPKLGSVVVTAEIDGILFDESEGSYWRSGWRTFEYISPPAISELYTSLDYLYLRTGEGWRYHLYAYPVAAKYMLSKLMIRHLTGQPYV